MLKTGIINKKTILADNSKSAAEMGSGTLPVFATPAMVALMEATAAESVEALLGDGMTSVGTALEIKHISATPIGMSVWCESRLEEIDGRTLGFTVRAFDEYGLVGEGTHSRCVVNAEKFTKKANEKLCAEKKDGGTGRT